MKKKLATAAAFSLFSTLASADSLTGSDLAYLQKEFRETKADLASLEKDYPQCAAKKSRHYQ